MSTLTADTPACRLDAAPGVTPPRVVKAEWIKFRSLRSTWFSLGAALVVAIGLGVLFAVLRGNDFANHGGLPKGAGLRGLDPGEPARLFLAQLAVGVLGVLMITGEYSTGMIRASLVRGSGPQPGAGRQGRRGRRGHVRRLATIASLIAFLVGQAALSGHHFGVSLSSPGALRAVIGGGCYLALVALLGLGLRLRHPQHRRRARHPLRAAAGAAPARAGAAQLTGRTTSRSTCRSTPGTAVMSTMQRSDSLSPWAGIGVLAHLGRRSLGCRIGDAASSRRVMGAVTAPRGNGDVDAVATDGQPAMPTPAGA